MIFPLPKTIPLSLIPSLSHLSYSLFPIGFLSFSSRSSFIYSPSLLFNSFHFQHLTTPEMWFIRSRMFGGGGDQRDRGETHKTCGRSEPASCQTTRQYEAPAPAAANWAARLADGVTGSSFSHPLRISDCYLVTLLYCLIAENCYLKLLTC